MQSFSRKLSKWPLAAHSHYRARRTTGGIRAGGQPCPATPCCETVRLTHVPDSASQAYRRDSRRTARDANEAEFGQEQTGKRA